MDSILRYTTILVAHVLIVSLYVKYGSADYGLANNYLVKQVNRFDELGPSMEAAARWLKEQDPASSSAPNSERLTSIQQLFKDRKCDGIDIDRILDYEKSIDPHALNHYNNPSAHDHRMMVRLFEDHAEKCQKVYQTTYRTKEKQLDRTVITRVEILAKTLIESDRFPTSELAYYQAENLFIRYVRETVLLDGYIGRDIFGAALISNTRNEQNLKQVNHSSDEYLTEGFRVDGEDEIRDLAMKYLIEPCQIYVDKLGPDVFIPARYDARYYSSIDKTQSRYYLGWSYFMICQAVTINKEAVILDIVKSSGLRMIILGYLKANKG